MNTLIHKCIRCSEDDEKKLAAPHICNKCRQELQTDFDKAIEQREKGNE